MTTAPAIRPARLPCSKSASAWIRHCAMTFPGTQRIARVMPSGRRTRSSRYPIIGMESGTSVDRVPGIGGDTRNKEPGIPGRAWIPGGETQGPGLRLKAICFVLQCGKPSHGIARLSSINVNGSKALFWRRAKRRTRTIDDTAEASRNWMLPMDPGDPHSVGRSMHGNIPGPEIA